ncbi:hypothetical protein Q9L58_008415 [Maublancomyces gigas]|uniref:NADH-plastoquinone oxidoreductase subunit 5 n=1 Tax=Discina gigas TaxID=1032678 RepID=A0ABR3G9R0_9PEZI
MSQKSEESSLLLPPTTDGPQSVASTRWIDILGWHIWTVLSVSGTSVLLWLNFSEYFIGTEIGTSPQQSANYLGALQLVIKLHELTIVASIFCITQQWIVRDLLGRGTLLGLLGAESAMSAPSFIISDGFLIALRYGFQGIFTRPRQGNDSGPARGVFRLTIFTLCGCILSALAGPASGVLMIPRFGWHSDSRRDFIDSNLPAGWPNILIGTDNTRVELSAAAPFLDPWETNVFSLPKLFVIGGLDYWRDMMVELSREIANLDPVETTSQHGFTDHFGRTFMNTTSYDRRALDGNWTGGTKITCSMKDRFLLAKVSGRASSEMVKSVTNMQAIDAFVTCRSREKIVCSKTAVLSGNHTELDWCYMSVNRDNSTLDVLRPSQNLLMASNSADIRNIPPKIWITEGPRIENNSHYSESIEIVIERSHVDPEHIGLGSPSLTVCSFSAAIVSGIATSFGTFYTGENFEYFNHIVLPDGGIAEPRKFLFHENWLDRAYAYSHKSWQANISMEYPDTFLYSLGVDTDIRFVTDIKEPDSLVLKVPMVGFVFATAFVMSSLDGGPGSRKIT